VSVPAGGTPRWASQWSLQQHFQDHGNALNVYTVSDYNASALDTIRVGRRFTDEQGRAAHPRIGYFDQPTGRFTALTADGMIILTHFRCSEHYIRTRRHSTYR
jgi:hypothetical protein